jgi:hypothetical protein
LVVRGAPTTRQARRVETLKPAVRNSTGGRFCAGFTAFSYDLLEHVLVESEVSDEGFQPAVLVFEQAQAADFGDAHTSVLLLPAVEGLLGDAGLTADFQDGCAALDLPQSVSDLLVSELGFFISPPGFWRAEF